MLAINVSYFPLLAMACALHWIDAACTVPPSRRAVHNFGIVGGKEVKITEKPYVAVVGKQYCCATIVHEKFMLTTGQCGNIPVKYNLTVGTDNFPDGGTVVEVKKVHLHPKYNNTAFDYDISVLELKEKLVLSDRVGIIKMADANLKPNAGDPMEMLGFGETSKEESRSMKLHSLGAPFVDLKTCRQDYESSHVNVTDLMICAGGEEGKGACFGDAGGPLVYKGQVIGLMSWGNPCGPKGFPTVSTYVPAMRDFIDSVIKSNA